MTDYSQELERRREAEQQELKVVAAQDMARKDKFRRGVLLAGIVTTAIALLILAPLRFHAIAGEEADPVESYLATNIDENITDADSIVEGQMATETSSNSFFSFAESLSSTSLADLQTTDHVIRMKYLNVDSTMVNEGTKIDDIFATEDSMDAIVAQYENTIPLLDPGENSQYFVAMIDTTNFNSAGDILDSMFAMNDDDAHMIDDVIYDKDAGVAYVPKYYYDENAMKPTDLVQGNEEEVTSVVDTNQVQNPDSNQDNAIPTDATNQTETPEENPDASVDPDAEPTDESVATDEQVTADVENLDENADVNMTGNEGTPSDEPVTATDADSQSATEIDQLNAQSQDASSDSDEDDGIVTGSGGVTMALALSDAGDTALAPASGAIDNVSGTLQPVSDTQQMATPVDDGTSVAVDGSAFVTNEPDYANETVAQDANEASADMQEDIVDEATVTEINRILEEAGDPQVSPIQGQLLVSYNMETSEQISIPVTITSQRADVVTTNISETVAFSLDTSIRIPVIAEGYYDRVTDADFVIYEGGTDNPIFLTDGTGSYDNTTGYVTIALPPLTVTSFEITIATEEFMNQLVDLVTQPKQAQAAVRQTASDFLAWGSTSTSTGSVLTKMNTKLFQAAIDAKKVYKYTGNVGYSGHQPPSWDNAMTGSKQYFIAPKETSNQIYDITADGRWRINSLAENVYFGSNWNDTFNNHNDPLVQQDDRNITRLSDSTVIGGVRGKFAIGSLAGSFSLPGDSDGGSPTKIDDLDFTGITKLNNDWPLMAAASCTHLSAGRVTNEAALKDEWLQTNAAQYNRQEAIAMRPLLIVTPEKDHVQQGYVIVGFVTKQLVSQNLTGVYKFMLPTTKISLKVKKTSSKDNKVPCVGAKYGLYKTKEDANSKKNAITTLTTNSKGETETFTVPVKHYTTGFQYWLKETYAPDGYIRDQKAHSVTLQANKTVTVSLTNDPTLELKIHKVSSKSKTTPCKGAKFALFTNSADAKATTSSNISTMKKKASYIGAVVTDEKGNTQAISVPPAKYQTNRTYYLKEYVVPTGYKIPAKTPDGQAITNGVVKVVVPKGKASYTVELANDPTLELKLHKVSSKSATTPCKGAKFALFTAQADAAATTSSNIASMQKKSSYIGIMETDANGNTKALAVPASKYQTNRTYYLKEYVVPTGYKIPAKTPAGQTITNGVIKVVVPSGKTSYTVELANDPSLELKLHKVSSENKTTPCKGATFGFFTNKTDAQNATKANMSQKASYIGSRTTDAKGNTTALDIPANKYQTNRTYYLKEVVTPAGYQTHKDAITVTVPANVTSYTIELTNDPEVVSVKVHKQDAETKKAPTSGTFVFALYDANKKELTAQGRKTSTNGTDVEWKDLLLGTYYVKEVQASYPYLVNNNFVKADATKSNPATVTVTVPNTQRRGDLTLTKTDKQDNTPLAGVTFNLKATQDVTSPDGTKRHTKNEAIKLTKKSDGNYEFDGKGTETALKTDSKGKLVVKNLYLTKGDTSFQFTETATVDGHIINKTPVTLTIKKNETSAAATLSANGTMTNDKNSIDIYKKALKDDSPIEGVTMAMWVSTNDLTVTNKTYMNNTNYDAIAIRTPSSANDYKPAVVKRTSTASVSASGIPEGHTLVGDTAESLATQEGNETSNKHLFQFDSSATADRKANIEPGVYRISLLDSTGKVIATATDEQGIIGNAMRAKITVNGTTINVETEKSGNQGVNATVAWDANQNAWIANNLVPGGASYNVEIGGRTVKIVKTSTTGGVTHYGRYSNTDSKFFAKGWLDQAALPKNDSTNILTKVTISGKEYAYNMVTDKNGHVHVDRLPINKNYTLVELKPAKYDNTHKSYLVDTNAHHFNVNSEGYIKDTDNTSNGYHDANSGTYAQSKSFVFKDDVTKLNLSKREITGGPELEGATLTLTDYETNDVIDEWVSTKEPHYIEGLVPGVYWLTERMTPNTYDQAEAVQFVLYPTGEIQHAEMLDAPISIDAEIDKRQEIAQPLNASHMENGDGKNNAKVSESPFAYYDYSLDFRSNSNTWTDEFTVEDPLDLVADDMGRLVSVSTPQAWQDYDGKMNVWYKTNKDGDNGKATGIQVTGQDGTTQGDDQGDDQTQGDDKTQDDTQKQGNDQQSAATANATRSDGHENKWLEDEKAMAKDTDKDGRIIDYTGWRVWATDLSTMAATDLKVEDLELAEGEYVTAVRFEYGRVEPGFTTRTTDWERALLKDEHDDLDDILTVSNMSFANADVAAAATTGAIERVVDKFTSDASQRAEASVKEKNEIEQQKYDKLIKDIAEYNANRGTESNLPERFLEVRQKPAYEGNDDDATKITATREAGKLSIQAAFTLDDTAEGRLTLRNAAYDALSSVKGNVDEKTYEVLMNQLLEFESSYLNTNDAERYTNAKNALCSGFCTVIDEIAATGLAGRVHYAPAILHMRATEKYVADTELHNTAKVDAYRNGGGDEKLEGHDDDEVRQKAKKREITIGTTLTADGGKKVLEFDMNDVTEEQVDATEIAFVDTVSYSGLRPGVEYTMVGTLHTKSGGVDGGVLVSGGKEVTASVKFTPERESGTVDVPMRATVGSFSPAPVVAFEELYYIVPGGTTEETPKDETPSSSDKQLLASHKDINDAGQTVDIVKLASDIIKSNLPVQTRRAIARTPLARTGDAVLIAGTTVIVLAVVAVVVIRRHRHGA